MSGVKELGYVVYEVSSLADWEHFGVTLLGMQLGEKTGNGFTLRTDEKAHRWVISEGPADDLVATGYEVEGADALDTLVEKLSCTATAAITPSPSCTRTTTCSASTSSRRPVSASSTAGAG
ncbi:hypothetical protein ACFRCW_21135 [Streptomyces sp. NPDC056653]|uniref:hypothetical protein n=1 Tax=Streptomyces sp. NPDC056653 TaxID=3345894 RepID=UPI0036CB9547